MELRSGRASIWFLIGCAVIASAVFVSRRVIASRDAQSAHAELVRQQALARSEGISLTVAEFIPHPPTTDAENAAPLYHQAAQLLIAANKESGLSQKFDTYHFEKPETLAADRAYLELAEPALVIAEKGARRPKCDPHPSYVVDYFNPAPNSEFKLLAKTAVGRAELEARDGHAVEALETIGKFAPLSGHVAQSRTMIDALVHAAVDDIFASEIRKILRDHGVEPRVAAQAVLALKALGPMPALVPMAEAENLITLDALKPEHLKQPEVTEGGPEEDKDTKRMLKLAKLPGLPDRWRALQIETTRRFVTLFKTYAGDWRDLEVKSDSLTAELDKPADNIHGWRAAMGGGPPWTGILDIMALELSNRRVLTQAAAALDILSRTGKLPANLPLTGEAARDPLGKGALHYKLSAKGFTIYGVGPHGVDHGGKPRDPKLIPADYDVVFIYPDKP